MHFFCRVRPSAQPAQAVLIDESSRTVRITEDADQRAPQAQVRRASPKRQGASTSVPRKPIARFDAVFNEASEQEDVFNAIVPHLKSACRRGGGCTILSYGGPGSGKTYTLQGSLSDARAYGIVPRALQLILGEVALPDPNSVMPMGGDSAPSVEAAFFEVAGDVLYDLLPRDPRSRGSVGVAIREAPNSSQVVITHLTQHRCEGSYQKMVNCYLAGLEGRRRNAVASCFQITLTHPAVPPEGRNAPPQKSYIRFIELASGKSGSTPRSKMPGGSRVPAPVLNKAPASISPQGGGFESVLNAKVSGQARVDYKGSPISLLLKPCLEGAMPLVMLHCMRLEDHYIPMLMSSLRVMRQLQQLMPRPDLRLEVTDGRPGGSSTPQRRPSVQEGESQAAPRASPPLRKAISPLPPRLPASLQQASTNAPHLQCGPSDSSGSVPPSLPSQPSTKEEVPTVVAHADRVDADGVDETNAGVRGQDLNLNLCTVPPTPSSKVIYEALVSKRMAAEHLAADARRSEKAMVEIEQIIGGLQQRRAPGEGPSDKETNMKVLHQRMNQSLRRSQEQLHMYLDEMEQFQRMLSDGQSMQSPYSEVSTGNHVLPVASPPQPLPLVPTVSASSPMIPMLRFDQLSPPEEAIAEAVGAPAIPIVGEPMADMVSSESSGSSQHTPTTKVTPEVLPLAPTALQVLQPIVSQEDSTPKARLNRAGGGGRKGVGISQPKQKSLMRQASRTSLLDLHGDAEGDGLQADDVEEEAPPDRELPRDASVVELLSRNIHNDREDEMVDVKVLDATVSSMTSAETHDILSSSTSAVYAKIVVEGKGPMTPIMPAMPGRMTHGSMNSSSPMRAALAGSVSTTVLGQAVNVGSMQKSLSSTSLLSSPGQSSPLSSAVTASPMARQRLTRADYPSGARSRMGAASPAAPLSRPLFGTRSAATVQASLASTTRVQSNSPMPMRASPGRVKPPPALMKSSYPSTLSPTQVYSTTPVRLGPGPVYPMQRSGSQKRI